MHPGFAHLQAAVVRRRRHQPQEFLVVVPRCGRRASSAVADTTLRALQCESARLRHGGGGHGPAVHDRGERRRAPHCNVGGAHRNDATTVRRRAQSECAMPGVRGVAPQDATQLQRLRGAVRAPREPGGAALDRGDGTAIRRILPGRALPRRRRVSRTHGRLALRRAVRRAHAARGASSSHGAPLPRRGETSACVLRGDTAAPLRDGRATCRPSRGRRSPHRAAAAQGGRSEQGGARVVHRLGARRFANVPLRHTHGPTRPVAAGGRALHGPTHRHLGGAEASGARASGVRMEPRRLGAWRGGGVGSVPAARAGARHVDPSGTKRRRRRGRPPH